MIKSELVGNFSWHFSRAFLVRYFGKVFLVFSMHKNELICNFLAFVTKSAASKASSPHWPAAFYTQIVTARKPEKFIPFTQNFWSQLRPNLNKSSFQWGLGISETNASCAQKISNWEKGFLPPPLWKTAVQNAQKFHVNRGAFWWNKVTTSGAPLWAVKSEKGCFPLLRFNRKPSSTL